MSRIQILTLIFLLFMAPLAISAETIPTGSTKSNSDGSFRVTWTIFGNWYEIREYKNGAYQGKSRSYSKFIDLSNKGNGQWKYAVTAYKRLSNGHFNEVFEINAGTAIVSVSIPKPSMPSSISAPSIDGDGTYIVSWGASSGSNFSYRLEERINNGVWSTVYTGGARSKAFSGRVAAEYDYRVRACNDLCSSYTAVQRTTIIKAPGGAEKPFSPATSSVSSYNLSWSAVAGVVGTYQLQERVNSESWQVIHDSATQSISLSNRSDATYEYRVRACNEAGCGGYSPISKTIVALPPLAPATITTSPAHSTTGVQSLSWSAAVGAVDYYHLQQQKAGDEWITVSQGAALTHEFTSLSDGSYVYSVRACNTTLTFTACSEATTSAIATVLLPPQVPVAISIPPTSIDGSYQFSWQNGGGQPASFVVEEYDGSNWVEVQNTNAFAFHVSGRADGDYEYRVKACNSSGCSVYSPSVYAAVLNIPSAPSVMAGPQNITVDSFQLSWSAGSGQITHYRLEEKYNTGDWLLAQESLAASISLSSKVAGTYQYRVSACNLSGCGLPSSIHQVVVNLSGVLPTPQASMLALPAVPADQLSTNDGIGSTGGSFRVDESGNATYSIPFSLAAGVAGVTPRLGLRYTSSSGNGLVGIGWSLQGLSAISRCRKTLSQDANAQPLTWSSDDRFCLDGQRLIPIDGSLYGQVGAVYTTEIDSFVRITSIGGIAGAPASFQVARKDGSVSTYGNTVDAKQAAENTRVLTWAQNEFQDSVGNRISFRYEGGIENHRLKSIDYAADTGSVTQSQVLLNYEARPDVIKGYVSGYEFSTTERLDSVVIKNAGVTVRHYDLEYLATSAANTVSRLGSLKECTDNNCYPPTEFQWQQSHLVLSQSGSSISLGGSHSRDLGAFNFKPADINGDGHTDIVWFYHLADSTNDVDYVLRYALSDGTKLIPTTFSNGDAGIRYNDDGGLFYEIVDYNGDGRQDVMIKSAGNWQVHLSTVGSNGMWQLASSTLTTPLADKNTLFVDVDSNGLVDAVHLGSSQLYISKMIPDGSQPVSSSRPYKFSSQPIYTGFSFSGGAVPVLEFSGDVNADGITDIGIHTSWGTRDFPSKYCKAFGKPRHPWPVAKVCFLFLRDNSSLRPF